MSQRIHAEAQRRRGRKARRGCVISGSSVTLCALAALRGVFIIFVVAVVFAFAACATKQALEDPPIITSATHQHTMYNGRGQPIEAIASREGAPSPVITYFSSEEDLHADRNGASEAPAEVGDYFVRVRRPAGNGYRAGNDITVEYHIQKALVTISAEARQEFAYDGNPRAIVFSVDKNVEPDVKYYHSASAMQGGTSPGLLQVTGLGAGSQGFPMGGPPSERGVYLAIISWSGDAHYMGASKEVELVIR